MRPLRFLKFGLMAMGAILIGLLASNLLTALLVNVMAIRTVHLGLNQRPPIGSYTLLSQTGLKAWGIGRSVNPRALWLRANLALQAGNREEAVRLLRVKAELQPADAVAEFVLARQLFESDQRDEALEIWRRIKADDYFVTRCWDSQSGRPYPSAVESCRLATEINPGNWMGFTRLGDVYRERGLWGQAISAYQRALRLKATPEAHFGLGLALARSGSFEAGREHLLVAHQMDRHSALYPLRLGDVYLAQGNLSEASQWYDIALEMSPGGYIGAESLYGLGKIAFERGDFQLALSYFERALQLIPDSAGFHLYLARSLSALGQDEQAIEHFRLAAESVADYPPLIWYRYEFARALVKGGRIQEACTEYQAILAHAPSDQVARQSLDDLASEYPGACNR